MGKLDDTTVLLFFVAAVFGAMFLAHRAMGVGPGFFRIGVINRQEHPREFAVAQWLTIGVAIILLAIACFRLLSGAVQLLLG